MTEAERTALRECLKDTPNPIIVQLGAHLGEDNADLEALGASSPRMHIMVEPDPDNVIALSRLCDVRRKLVAAAIGCAGGTRKFYRSFDPGGGHGSGSVLEPEEHLKYFPQISFPVCVDVQSVSLDSLYSWQFLDHCDLLYADVQGAENEMIQGGKKALAVTRYLFMEAEEIALYKGQVARPGLLKALTGWEQIGHFDYNLLLKNLNYKGPIE